jgi:hypothetical protein
MVYANSVVVVSLLWCSVDAWENKPLRSGTQLLTKSAPARFAMAEPGFFCIGYVPDPFSIGKSRKSLIADEATTPAPKLYLASWRDGCSVCIQPSGPR